MTGWLLGNITDFIAVLAVAYAQWRIVRAALSFAKPRVAAATLGLLRVAFALSALALMLAFVIGFHRIASHVALPRGVEGWMHGTAFLWSFSSTGAWYIYALWKRLVVPHVDVEFDPNRRRLVRSAGGVLVPATRRSRP